MSSDGARFVAAALENDMEAVQSLLKRHVTPNVRDWDRRTPLIAAAVGGHLELVKFLVSKKADILLRDSDDISVLAEAVIGGHTEIVRYLLTLSGREILIELTAASGATPLWFAAAEGKLEIVQMLLAVGSEPDRRRVDDISPIIASAANGFVDVTNIFIDAGADVNYQTKPEGLTALFAACENRSFFIIDALLRAGANPNTLTEMGFSPLIIASAYGRVDIVRRLLESGAEPDMAHPENVSALMYACSTGQESTVELLLSLGKDRIDVNRVHSLGGAAIMEAVTVGNIPIYRMLVNAGANVSIQDFDGVNLLITAATHGQTAMAR